MPALSKEKLGLAFAAQVATFNRDVSGQVRFAGRNSKRTSGSAYAGAAKQK